MIDGLIFPWLLVGSLGVCWAAFRIWDDLREWRRATRGKR